MSERQTQHTPVSESYCIARAGVERPEYILSGACVRRVFSTPEAAQKFLLDMYPQAQLGPGYSEGYHVVRFNAAIAKAEEVC